MLAHVLDVLEIYTQLLLSRFCLRTFVGSVMRAEIWA